MCEKVRLGIKLIKTKKTYLQKYSNFVTLIIMSFLEGYTGNYYTVVKLISQFYLFVMCVCLWKENFLSVFLVTFSSFKSVSSELVFSHLSTFLQWTVNYNQYLLNFECKIEIRVQWPGGTPVAAVYEGFLNFQIRVKKTVYIEITCFGSVSFTSSAPISREWGVQKTFRHPYSYLFLGIFYPSPYILSI